MRKTTEQEWAYLHAKCHPASPTWLRLGPNRTHVLECAECRKVITAFRIDARPNGDIAAENVQREPNLRYEDILQREVSPCGHRSGNNVCIDERGHGGEHMYRPRNEPWFGEDG